MESVFAAHHFIYITQGDYVGLACLFALVSQQGSAKTKGTTPTKFYRTSQFNLDPGTFLKDSTFSTLRGRTLVVRSSRIFMKNK